MPENAGQQLVDIDLHHRRSVIVRSTGEGEVLEADRIVNDVDRLNSVIARLCSLGERGLVCAEDECVLSGTVGPAIGDVELASGRALAPFSRAGLVAADNLLAKGDRALTDGDLERASHFVSRAVAL